MLLQKVQAYIVAAGGADNSKEPQYFHSGITICESSTSWPSHTDNKGYGVIYNVRFGGGRAFQMSVDYQGHIFFRVATSTTAWGSWAKLH